MYIYYYSIHCLCLFMQSVIGRRTGVCGCSPHTGMWKDRDEAMNFMQKHDIEIIKDEKRCTCSLSTVEWVRPSPPHSPHPNPLHPLRPIHPPHPLTRTILLHPSYHRKELEAETRLQVDDLMREELKNLKLVCPTSRGACQQSQLYCGVLTSWPTGAHSCFGLEGLADCVHRCVSLTEPRPSRLSTGTKVAKERRKRRARCSALLSRNVCK